MTYINPCGKIVAILAAALASCSLATPAFAAETYKLDPLHTAVLWHISHMGFSTPSGKFMNVEGTLVLDRENPAASKVNVTIPITKVDSGVPHLDEHLQTKDFFDSATYPTATYTSSSVNLTGKDTAIVHGTLTMRGVSKPVDLKVKLNKLGVNFSKVPTVGFTASATIKRTDFGMGFFVPMLGDEVQLEIESEANGDAPAK